MDVGFALMLEPGNALELCPGFEAAHIEAGNAVDEMSDQDGRPGALQVTDYHYGSAVKVRHRTKHCGIVSNCAVAMDFS